MDVTCGVSQVQVKRLAACLSFAKQVGFPRPRAMVQGLFRLRLFFQSRACCLLSRGVGLCEVIGRGHVLRVLCRRFPFYVFVAEWGRVFRLSVGEVGCGFNFVER